MPSANPQRVLRVVEAILGRPGQRELHYQDVHAARIESGMEILRAVASNSRHGYFGSLSALVTVAHNAFLPTHDGEPGIPRIVPFSGATAREGLLADPDDIDSWRADELGLFTGALDGVAVPHNEADENGLPSPVSCRYSLINGVLKFTGLSAQVPLVQLTRTMADTGVPEPYEPTIVKLTVVRVAPPDFPSLERYRASAQEDLILIRGGELKTSPVSAIAQAQKAVI